MVFAEVASAGLSGLAGFFGAKSKQDAARLARKRGQYVIDERMRPLLDLYFNQQLQQLQEGKAGIAEGYAQAENEVSKLGRGQIRQAKEAGLQDAGRLTSGLVGSGAYGTSVRGNLARGVQSDVTRRIQDINESLAGLRANLYTNRGQALAGANASIAGLYGSRLGTELNLEQLRYGLFTGTSGGAADDIYGANPFSAGLAALAGNVQGQLGDYAKSNYGQGTT